MLKEFKAFIMRGNVLDLAIAVITPHLRSVQVSAAHLERSSAHSLTTSSCQ